MRAILARRQETGHLGQDVPQARPCESAEVSDSTTTGAGCLLQLTASSCYSPAGRRPRDVLLHVEEVPERAQDFPVQVVVLVKVCYYLSEPLCRQSSADRQKGFSVSRIAGRATGESCRGAQARHAERGRQGQNEARAHAQGTLGTMGARGGYCGGEAPPPHCTGKAGAKKYLLNTYPLPTNLDFVFWGVRHAGKHANHDFFDLYVVVCLEEGQQAVHNMRCVYGKRGHGEEGRG